MMKKKLVVFAQKGEAEKTIERFQAIPVDGEFADIWSEGHIPCLYAFDYGWIALCSVGSLAAQMAVAKFGSQVEEIWNLGLAGRLRGDLPIGKLLSIQKVAKYTPLSPSEIDEGSFEILQNIHPLFSLDGEAQLISSDFPVHDPQHSSRLANTFDLVDMEGYGIAYAALSLKKKCRMWKIISDFASPGGRELIRKNKSHLSERLADHLEEMLCKQ